MKSDLEKAIKYHREKYYSGNPVISDSEYDKLEDQLRNIDPENPLLLEVGHSKPKRKKINTPKFMGSLPKISKESFQKYFADNLKGRSIFVSEKLDGMSIFIQFRDGDVHSAGTRGDGNIGEDITDKAKIFSKKYPGLNATLRGEVIIEGSSHEKIGYKNRRNAVSGIINSDSNSNCDKLSVKFYDVLEGDTEGLHPLEWMSKNNIDAVRYFKYEGDGKTLQGVIDEIIKISNKPKEYDIDGCVIDFYDGERGESKKIAYKSSTESVETEVKFVDWNITRTGRCIPVVNFEKISLGGVEISKATGFNAKYILDKKIDKGSKISIIRSNETIPYIVSSKESPEFDMISACPKCGSELKWDGVDLVCDSKNCGDIEFIRAVYFIRTMGIEHISGGILKKIGIEKIEDLYDESKVNINKMSSIKGIGRITAEKIKYEINKTLNTTPSRFISAMGVDNFSSKMAEKIVSKFSFDEIFDLNENQLTSIEGIGKSKADSFIKSIPRIKEVYQYLKNIGLEFISEEPNVVNNSLSNKSFCLTGTLSKPRRELERMIIENGGRISGINKKLDFLVTGSNSTEWKVSKARDSGISIIDEKKLMEMIK